MPCLSPEQIAQAIQGFLERPNPTLFAGAGVGCRVGFPTWGEFIEHLAATCERFRDGESAVLIRKRLEQGHHLAAASVFKTSTEIPTGEMWKAMAAPFLSSTDDLDKLAPLVSLPFGAIVTTNYDKSLHDACAAARGRWAAPVERGRLRAASQNRDFFISRIHGSADNPTSMVVDTADYQLLRKDDDYLDFLIAALAYRSCLFLGFSFLDPAISHVLDVYEERFGPDFQALHAAIIPEGDTALTSRLRRLNVEPFVYAKDGNHSHLWQALRLAWEVHKRAARGARAKGLDVTFGQASIHRFVAFTYAQIRIHSDTQSVAILAQDGLVASIVSSRTDESVGEDLVTEVAATLRLSKDQAQRAVRSSLNRLAKREQILQDGERVTWIGAAESDHENSLILLARAVQDRMRVRLGVKASEADIRATRLAIEHVLLTRAWDIGAHLAGGTSGWSFNVEQMVREFLDTLAGPDRPTSPVPLARAMESLLNAPDEGEAQVLAVLGRAAFGTQLLLASPRQTLFHKYALPRRIYLDASVLMPAITQGHPLRPVYSDALKRLEEAAELATVPTSVTVGYQFLNEIVTHRQHAIEIVNVAGLEDHEKLRNFIQFYSAANVNVFVGAYGTIVGRSGSKVRFKDFLSKAAPFTTEDQLAKYLGSLGIEAMKMEFQETHNLNYVRILNPLKAAYEDLPHRVDKASVLIDHEAQQITQLAIDAQEGLASIFITADRKLRQALANRPELVKFTSSLLSHLGLVALADVLVGLQTDSRALARLVWVAPFGDEKKALLDHFVNLGLREYDEALSQDLQQIAIKASEEADESAKRENVELFSDRVEDIEKTAEFLDRFEKRFYEWWREAIERKERQD